MPSAAKPPARIPKIPGRDQSANMQFTEAQARALGIPIKGKSKPATPEKVTGNNVGTRIGFRKR